jgi:hypothetical protein
MQPAGRQWANIMLNSVPPRPDQLPNGNEHE